MPNREEHLTTSKADGNSPGDSGCYPSTTRVSITGVFSGTGFLKKNLLLVQPPSCFGKTCQMSNNLL